MQTLIDKNEALRKEVEQLQRKITDLKNTPLPRRNPTKKSRKKKSTKGSMYATLRKWAGIKNEEEDVYNPKRAETANHVHALILDGKYDEADACIEENKKVLFGRIKKGEETPTLLELEDQFGETVLMKAIKEGKGDLVMDLLDKGAAIDTADKDGETPLMVAARYGELAIVRAMVKKANRDAKTTSTKKTALHYAAEHGHLDVVEELLSNGCDVLIEDSDGNTPLQVSSTKEVKKAIKDVQKKQNKNFEDEEDESEQEEEAKGATGIDKLLDKKERSYSQDEEMKPLFEERKRLEAQKKRLELQFQDLKRKRAPRTKIGLGNFKRPETSALVKKFHQLVLRGNEQSALEEVEEMLTEKRPNMQVDRNAKDEFGETALMKASRLGYDEMVDFLILYKCDVDARDIEGYTALMKAAQFGKQDCCMKLISDGADINASCRNGKLTALMLAAQRGHGELCEMLIAEGADHTMRNSSDQRAVDMASNEEARQAIEKAMEEHPVSKPPVQI